MQTIPQSKSLYQALIDGMEERVYTYPNGEDTNPDIRKQIRVPQEEHIKVRVCLCVRRCVGASVRVCAYVTFAVAGTRTDPHCCRVNGLCGVVGCVLTVFAMDFAGHRCPGSSSTCIPTSKVHLRPARSATPE